MLVVVPTLNEAAHIEQVLEQLAADSDDDGVRYVVVDGGSTDGTQSIVGRMARRMHRLQLLHNPKRLQGAGVNLAVSTYGNSAEVLVRCDAHAEYPPHYVRDLAASLVHHDADSIVVPMDSEGATCMGRAVAWVSDSLVGSGGSAHRGGRASGWVDHGHHAAFQMSSFIRAGGYDDTFSHNEDAEFDCRQRAVAHRIYLDADIRVRYFTRETWGGLWRQYYNYGRGRGRTIRRHPASWRLRQAAVPFHLFVTVLAVLLSPFWNVTLAWPAAYLAVLTSNAVVLGFRHRSACAVLAAPVAAVLHTAWAAGFFRAQARDRDERWTPETLSDLPMRA